MLLAIRHKRTHPLNKNEIRFLGVFRGMGGLACACPTSADPNFYDGIFAVLLIFFLPKHQHLDIH